MNYSLTDVFNLNPYQIQKSIKYKIFQKKINQLTKYHEHYCKEYKQIINLMRINFTKENYPPFLHSSIFKSLNLKTQKKNP